ncbi:hypothetical protein [Spirosoma foliorum]|uniref:Uncharacterized protein n=1 Tax=Spirosoma foliorum TaxID=2710596 RepID=A0A7G5H5J9_9BACT|nr:hypothetical protein [Spirosoma foliorum]QMW06391.1 hypothetical protein H3H32_16610 [Spirosoma foliorum]
MKILKTFNWLRRDFSATFECEACGHQQTDNSCYDDANFYINVIPDMKCEKCGESTNSQGLTPYAVTPRYDPNITM